jgi:hypothetical protein
MFEKVWVRVHPFGAVATSKYIHIIYNLQISTNYSTNLHTPKQEMYLWVWVRTYASGCTNVSQCACCILLLCLCVAGCLPLHHVTCWCVSKMNALLCFADMVEESNWANQINSPSKSLFRSWSWAHSQVCCEGPFAPLVMHGPKISQDTWTVANCQHRLKLLSTSIPNVWKEMEETGSS